LPEDGFRIVAEYQDRSGDEIPVPELEFATWFSGKVVSNELDIVPGSAVTEALERGGACGVRHNLQHGDGDAPKPAPSTK
jgi:hypothetical protein